MGWFMDILHGTNAVIDKLGGTKATAYLTGRHKAQVSYWRKSNRFPAQLYLIMKGALNAVDCDASDDLWGMNQQEAAE